MAVEPLDLDALLRPISDEHPTGLPLRDDDSDFRRDFYNIRDAATEARGAERKLANYIPPIPGEEDPYKPDPPDWKTVYESAVDILSNKSKDLWVAAWLIEAACRLHGFAGLRDGFKLVHELCDRYWDDLHPRESAGDVDNLVAQLGGLNGVEGEGTLIDPIKAIPITADHDPGPFSFEDFVAAARLQQEEDAARRQRRIDDGEVSLEQFERAAALSTGSFYPDLLAAVDAAISEFAALNQVLEERCYDEEAGRTHAPPSSNIGNTLADVRRRVAILAGENENEGEESEGGEGSEESRALVAGTQVSTVADGQITSRDEAFRHILAIAGFFEKTEPHSPVSYGLRQVVRWGRLSLPELLMQLIDHEDTRSQLFRQIGIEKPTDEEE